METLTEHYLDNSATTQVLPSVAQKALELMTEEYGNPSSLHTRGFRARQQVEEARALVAQKLGASPEEIVFTSGGTEGNNLALFGAAQARRRMGNKIVTTAGEHDSVLQPCRELERQGFQVVYLELDREGHLPVQALEEAIDGDTILVSLMLVNNETGAIFPVEAAARAIRRKKAPALLHVDGVQAFGKLPFTVKKLGVDLLTLSGHKVHAPKGVGALYVKKGVRLLPRTLGGGQERSLRSGTESVPLIGALGEAVRLLPPCEEALAHVRGLHTLLREGLSRLPQGVIHSPEDGLPYVLNISPGPVRGETMLHFLAQRGVYVSSGSACGKAKPSHVLQAMGLPKEQVETALRVSFSRFSTQEDVEALLEGLQAGLASLAHRA